MVVRTCAPGRAPGSKLSLSSYVLVLRFAIMIMLVPSFSTFLYLKTTTKVILNFLTLFLNPEMFSLCAIIQVCYAFLFLCFS